MAGSYAYFYVDITNMQAISSDSHYMDAVIFTGFEISSNMCMWIEDTQEREIMTGCIGQNW